MLKVEGVHVWHCLHDGNRLGFWFVLAIWHFVVKASK